MLRTLRSELFILGILVCLFFSYPPIIKWILQLPLPLPSPDNGVGQSALLGLNKTSELIAFALPWLFTLLVGVCLGLVRKLGVHQPFWNDGFGKVGRTAHRLPTMVLLSFAIVVYSFLVSWNDNIFTMNSFSENFDGQVGLLSTYLVSNGFLPFKDFWYAKGGTYLFFPTSLFSVTFRAVHISLVIVLAAWLLYHLFDKSLSWTLGTLSFFYIAKVKMPLDFCGGSFRYLLGSQAILLFIVISGRTAIYGYLFFGFFLGWMFMVEPMQLFYTIPSLALLFLIHFYRNKPPERASYLKRCASGYGLTLLFIGAILVQLLRQGQWTGFINFFLDLSAFSGVCAVPSGILYWHTPILAKEMALLLGIHLLVGYGTFAILVDRGRQHHPAREALLPLGLYLTCVFTKQLIRPHCTLQLIPACLIGLVLYLYALSRLWTGTKKIILLCCIFLGFCLPWKSWLENFKTGIKHTVAISEFVRKSRSLAQRVQDSNGWRKFLTPDNKAVLTFLVNEKKNNPELSFYVLGNDMYLYAAIRTKPPYYFNMHDGATLFGQQTVLRWLNDQKPDWVLFNSKPKGGYTDGIGPSVRIPLIVAELATHYVLERELGNFLILRRNDHASISHLHSWERVLGTTLDLQKLPGATQLPGANTAHTATVSSQRYLVIKSNHMLTKDVRRSLAFRIANREFVVTFIDTPGTDVIDLSRLWFWTLAKKARLAIEMGEPQDCANDNVRITNCPQQESNYFVSY
ncbi:MAG: hypothetical protein HY537_06590 [Deltaproteobacteria bacterium]|nr:hypothetical protein [Deltaproteobacteria bacterium]